MHSQTNDKFWRYGTTAERMYVSVGLSPDRIGKTIDVSPVTIRKWAKTYGWDKARDKKRLDSDIEQREEALKVELDDLISDCETRLKMLRAARAAMRRK